MPLQVCRCKCSCTGCPRWALGTSRGAAELPGHSQQAACGSDWTLNQRGKGRKGCMVDLAYGGMLPLDVPGVAWRKSSYSNPSGDCVETARLPSGRVAVRDSTRPGGPVLVFTAAR